MARRGLCAAEGPWRHGVPVVAREQPRGAQRSSESLEVVEKDGHDVGRDIDQAPTGPGLRLAFFGGRALGLDPAARDGDLGVELVDVVAL